MLNCHQTIVKFMEREVKQKTERMNRWRRGRWYRQRWYVDMPLLNTSRTRIIPDTLYLLWLTYVS
jgi:hypothetical protein